jgi:hypothetical protein
MLGSAGYPGVAMPFFRGPYRYKEHTESNNVASRDLSQNHFPSMGENPGLRKDALYDPGFRWCLSPHVVDVMTDVSLASFYGKDPIARSRCRVMTSPIRTPPGRAAEARCLKYKRDDFVELLCALRRAR